LFGKLDIAYLCTKFDSYSLSRSLDIDEGSKIKNGLRDVTTFCPR